MNRKITLTEGQLRNIVRQTLLEEGLFDFLTGGKDTSNIKEKDLMSTRQAVANELSKLRKTLETALKSDKSKPLDVLDTVLKMLQRTISNAVLVDAEKAMKGGARPWVLDLDKKISWFENTGTPGKDNRLDPGLYYMNKLGDLGTIGAARVSELAQLPGIEDALSAWVRGAIASPLRLGPLVEYSKTLTARARDEKLAVEVMKLVTP